MDTYLLAECEVPTASYGLSFSFHFWPKHEVCRPWKQGRKKRGSITCRTDRANQANKMFIIWLCWLFRFWKGDRELEVCMATYRPGIDQSQHAKSVSHIIIKSRYHSYNREVNTFLTYSLWESCIQRPFSLYHSSTCSTFCNFSSHCFYNLKLTSYKWPSPKCWHLCNKIDFLHSRSSQLIGATR